MMSRRDPNEPDPPWEGPEPLQPSEEPEALPLPEFDAAEPEAPPLPEWPSLESLQRRTAPIPDVPQPSEEQRQRWQARHKAAMERTGGDKQDGEWQTFKVSGDELSPDSREIRDRLTDIAKNIDPTSPQTSVSFDRIERSLAEIVSLLRRMA